jgi:hypothetical protein
MDDDLQPHGEFADPDPEDATIGPDREGLVPPPGVEDLPIPAEIADATPEPVLDPSPPSTVPLPSPPASFQEPVAEPARPVDSPPMDDWRSRQDIHGDMVDLTEQVRAGTVDIRSVGSTLKAADTAAQVRERKPTKAEERKEATLDREWRGILGSLGTTTLVHVRLRRRNKLTGSFEDMGTRYDVDAEDVRRYNVLVPYGDGTNDTVDYILEVARADARVDDKKAWRSFRFSKPGPPPPLGWSFDSPYNMLDKEVDMNTIREAVRMAMSEMTQQPQQAVPAPQQQVMNPWTGAATPTPGWNYPPPHLSYMNPEEERRRREEDERRRREEQEWHRRREEEDRRRADEERKRRDEEEKRLRDDRERYERERKAAEETRRKELEAIQAQIAAANERALKAEQEAKERTNRMEAEFRERENKLQLERADAQRQAEMKAMETRFETLVGELRAIKERPPEKPQQDWVTVLPTIVPLVTAYVASQKETALEERRLRAEETARDRDRMRAEGEMMQKVMSMVAENQINSARANAEMMTRLQDPSAFMGMTKLVGETLQGQVGMIANLAKSGLLGGGGGGNQIDWTTIIGTGLEALGGVAQGIMEMQAGKAGQMALPPGMPTGMPPELIEQYMAAQQRQPEHPQSAASQMAAAQARQRAIAAQEEAAQQAQARAAAAGRPVVVPPEPDASQEAPQARPEGILRRMVDTIKTAVGREEDPEKVAQMFIELVRSARTFEVGQDDPKVQAYIQALRSDPHETLKRTFTASNEEYLRAVADLLKAHFAEEEEEGEAEEPEEGEEEPGEPGEDEELEPMPRPEASEQE